MKLVSFAMSPIVRTIFYLSKSIFFIMNNKKMPMEKLKKIQFRDFNENIRRNYNLQSQTTVVMICANCFTNYSNSKL